MLALVFSLLLLQSPAEGPNPLLNTTQYWVTQTWNTFVNHTDKDTTAYTESMTKFISVYNELLVCLNTRTPPPHTDSQTYKLALEYSKLLAVVNLEEESHLKSNGRAIKWFLDVWGKESHGLMFDTTLVDPGVPPDPDLDPDWFVTPTTIASAENSTGSITSRQPIIETLYGADRNATSSKNRQPVDGWRNGDVAYLAPGDYRNFRWTRTTDVDPAKVDAIHLNPDGSIRYGLRNDDKIKAHEVTWGYEDQNYLIAEVPGTVRIMPKNVGGTKSCYIEWGGAVTFQDIIFAGDDDSAIKTENPKRSQGEWQGFRDIEFIRCQIDGGANFETDDHSKWGKVKWGMLTYMLGRSARGDDVPGFLWSGGITPNDDTDWDISGIWHEHAFYHHNVIANNPDALAMVCENIRVRWCGRTLWQQVARKSENPDGDGMGHVILRHIYGEDVCVQQSGGGSALTFAGNHDGLIEIIDVTIMLGCNPNLSETWHDNITGSFVSHAGGGSGGVPTRHIRIEDCHFEVGKHFPGKGSARRPNVNVSNVVKFELLNTAIWNYTGAAEALDIKPGSILEIILDDDNDVRGDCIYGGVKYKDIDSDGDGLGDGEGYRLMLEAIKDDPKVQIVAAPVLDLSFYRKAA